MKPNVIPIFNVEKSAEAANPARIENLADEYLFPPDKPLEIRIARSARELHDAYHLVYNQYCKIGYQIENDSKIRFTPHFALPTSHTFIALSHGEVAATLTMVIDGALGLPMEKEYPEEIQLLRRKSGALLAEISCLVTRRSRDLTLLLQLFYAAYIYALHRHKVSDFCVAIAPEHQSFYRHAMLLEQIGPVKEYALINHMRTVAMRLNLPSAEQRYHKAHSMRKMLGRFFLGKEDLQQIGRNLKHPDQSALQARLEFARAYLDRNHLPAAVTQHIDDAFREALLTEESNNLALAS
ncbi:MAG: hypothetical protein IDH49_09875 [Gammaproteobacteria bacterium]|nr:hypothetical protein [Gammaproteobacteria bacterium]